MCNPRGHCCWNSHWVQKHVCKITFFRSMNQLITFCYLNTSCLRFYSVVHVSVLNQKHRLPLSGAFPVVSSSLAWREVGAEVRSVTGRDPWCSPRPLPLGSSDPAGGVSRQSEAVPGVALRSAGSFLLFRGVPLGPTALLCLSPGPGSLHLG